jgi:hypothetical protein
MWGHITYTLFGFSVFGMSLLISHGRVHYDNKT